MSNTDFYTRQETMGLNTDKKVVVVGVGGVGWHVAKGLAMAGVEDITVFDMDTVEIHNLSRLDIPYGCLGKNKATLLKEFVDQMRPDNQFKGVPYKFNPDVVDMSDVDILVDCTDNHESQLRNQQVARDNDLQYMKVGYNGSHITIADSVAEWDANPEGSQDGYTIIPSYISPAIIVAGLAINTILTDGDREISVDINDLYS